MGTPQATTGPGSMLHLLGSAIEDADEETFLLFIQDLPNARDLGFVNSKATSINVELGDDGHELEVTQSPSLLSSSISTGTTGAVLWRVSPLVAAWLRQKDNFLFSHGILGPLSTVVELGCGITGLVALSVSPRTGLYICTDQHYVLKGLRQNITEHLSDFSPEKASPVSQRKATGKQSSKPSTTLAVQRNAAMSNIRVVELDWETSLVKTLIDEIEGLDGSLGVVLACDCIYNSHLVGPFIRTCVELCQLKRMEQNSTSQVVCLVAQQLRSEEVFSEWLTAFMKEFMVWRVPESLLSEGLAPAQGFVLHLGILRMQL